MPGTCKVTLVCDMLDVLREQQWPATPTGLARASWSAHVLCRQHSTVHHGLAPLSSSSTGKHPEFFAVEDANPCHGCSDNAYGAHRYFQEVVKILTAYWRYEPAIGSFHYLGRTHLAAWIYERCKS
eukprot:134577-Amphidinium_carterae.2